MRYLIIAALLIGSAPTARAQVGVSVGIAIPGVQIGINMPTYPELVQVPGYPVYYDPRGGSNYFFYDGAYWVYQGDSWYTSSWYNGPWHPVAPEYVPAFVLRVPVRYYRAPPPYFRGWRRDAPPRWGEHWGRDWEGRRRGWDRWDRRAGPRPAPLPVYQRGYPADRYPGDFERQRAIRDEEYRYRPREDVTRRHWDYRGGPPGEPQRPQPGYQGPPGRQGPPPGYQGPPPGHQGPPPGREGPPHGDRRGDPDERDRGRGR